jgi:hypothetical protein
MKRFDSTQSKFTHLFRVVTIFINLIQRTHMDFTYQVVGDQNPNLNYTRLARRLLAIGPKFVLTCVLNFCFYITPKSLIAFKLLILIFLRSLLISTLPARKAFQSSKVEA